MTVRHGFEFVDVRDDLVPTRIDVRREERGTHIEITYEEASGMTMGEEFFEAYRVPWDEEEDDRESRAGGGKLWVPKAIVTTVVGGKPVTRFTPEYEALLDAARDLDVDVEIYDDSLPADDPAILGAFAACGVSGAIVASIIWTVVLWLT